MNPSTPWGFSLDGYVHKKKEDHQEIITLMREQHGLCKDFLVVIGLKKEKKGRDVVYEIRVSEKTR
jgi:hypothetical protein